jgi:lipopolysaccharide transport system ATP-binding protein
MYDSLRDLIPALTRRLLGRQRPTNDERDFWALDDVSFQVQRGEAFGVVGQNGAGKSTMLKLLCGIMRPTKGRIVVRGRLSALIEVSAGFHPDLTGRENIFLNGTIIGMSRAEIRRKFDQIVEFSGLAAFLDTPVKRYSSGMFARLGFSVAAHVEPDILIVDEVLSVGDYLFQQKCVERMEAVIREGATIIFVSHNLRAVTDLCRRSLLLEAGRVVETGPTAAVVQTYLTRGRALYRKAETRTLSLSYVRLRDGRGERLGFTSGEEVTVEVAIEAHEPCHEVSIEIEIVDESQFVVFNTGTQRLGHEPLHFEAGERATVAFDLALHLGGGTYRINVYAFRYVTNSSHDQWFSVATFFVGEIPTLKGVANLAPRLAKCVVTRTSAQPDPAASR